MICVYVRQNIVKTDLKQQCEGVDFIHVSSDQDHWMALLNA
jgi:hypothetical protein